MDFDDAFSEHEQVIIRAYLGLMLEEPYDKITVKEITQRCSLSRTTFYRSFEDVYDLLERIERYLLDELWLYRHEDMESHPVCEPVESIERWIDVGISLRPMLRSVMGENGDLYFKERLKKQVTDGLNLMMDDERVPNDTLRPYYVDTIAAAYIGLLNHIALVEDSNDLLPACDIVTIANSMRIAYFKSASDAPEISETQLFGGSDTRGNE
ncbi:MAG: TetR/AcrR family transcriptional regulator [Coriobacteriales bacterium]|jgi:AcrR family transcriptional regulator